MFKIDSNTKQIMITRGDIGTITVSALNEDETDYEFQVGDIIRFGVFTKKNMNDIKLQKDVEVITATTEVDINLNSEDTTIGDIINKPVDYWYEIQLNPDTEPQTLIGYDDEEGARLFTLYPEGVKE